VKGRQVRQGLRVVGAASGREVQPALAWDGVFQRQPVVVILIGSDRSTMAAHVCDGRNVQRQRTRSRKASSAACTEISSSVTLGKVTIQSRRRERALPL
jgi:hypothetical protein